MKKVIKKSSFVIALTLVFISVISNSVYGINPDYYKPNSLTYEEGEQAFIIGANLMNIVRNVGVIISIVCLSFIGLKYMLGSVEQKAQYKETMFPYVVGCILLGASSILVGIIAKIFG